MEPNTKRTETTSSKSNRIFGMIASLILGCFVLILLGMLAGLILSNAKSLLNMKLPPAPQRPTEVVDNYIVGTWLDTWVGTCTITIKKINGSYQMTRLYTDGSGETKPLIVQTVEDTERFIELPDSPTKDYMVIENGNLVFYDNAGFIYEDYPSPLVELSTQVDQATQEIESITTPTLIDVSPQVDLTTAQKIIFIDDFQDSGITSENWSSLGGTWVVENGVSSCVANGKYLANITIPEDFTFQLDIMGVNVVDKIIVFRAIDDSTHYGIDFRTAPYNDIVLVKSLPGNIGHILQTVPFGNYNNIWYTIKVDVENYHIKASVDNQPIIDFIDASSPITGGTIGVGAMLQPGFSVVYYDNIAVSTH